MALTPALEPDEITQMATATSPPHTKSPKLCFWYYHHGSCRSDPQNPDRTGKKACPHKHHLPLKIQDTQDGEGREANPPQLSSVAPWMHKKPCGLPLCPWKNREGKGGKKMVVEASRDGGPAVEAAKGVKGGYKRKRQPESDDNTSTKQRVKRFKMDSREAAAPSPAKSTKAEKNKSQQRNRHIPRHRDDPTNKNSRTINQQLSYDEVDQAPPPTPNSAEHIIHDEAPSQPSRMPANPERSRRNEPVNETCFFWYHGHCARASDPRNNFTCTHLHALTDPPTMVQPPPRYIHKEECGRQWCPGDARQDKGDARPSRKGAGGGDTGARSSKPKGRGGDGGKEGPRKKEKKVKKLLQEWQQPEDEEGADDAGSEAGSEVPSCGQPEERGREEWYLRGFDEA